MEQSPPNVQVWVQLGRELAAPLRGTPNSSPRRGLASCADGPSSPCRKAPSGEGQVSFKHPLLGPFLAPASCRLDWPDVARWTLESVWSVDEVVKCSVFTQA